MLKVAKTLQLKLKYLVYFSYTRTVALTSFIMAGYQKYSDRNDNTAKP